MENRNAKSLLAKLMAAEDLNVEYSEKAVTASFDTERRTLRMPLLKGVSDEATDLFLGHEVGHALYTPQGEIIEVMKKGGMYKGFVNVVEDARIEKMIQNKFPGLRRCFYDGYSELMERDFFGTNGKDVNEYNFIDRLNLHFKVGIRASVDFSDEEMVYVDRMSNLRTWEETIKLSDDLYEYCKNNSKDEESENNDDTDSDESVEGDADEGESTWNGDTDSNDNNEETGTDDKSDSGSGKSDEDGEEEGNTDSDEDSDEDGDDGETDKDGEGESEEAPIGSIGDKGSDASSNNELTTKTQNNFDSKLEDLVDTESINSYLRIPKIPLDKIIIPMSKVHEAIDDRIRLQPERSIAAAAATDFKALASEDFKKFSSEQKSLISYLIKEFEMRKSADEHKRTREGKTGILNPNKLHAYKFSEDIFLRNSVVSDGKNHGFVMFVDWSGSMTECMPDTLDQLMMLAMFCKKAQIPFDVFAFTNAYNRAFNTGLNTPYYAFDECQENDIGIRSNFSLMHLISSTLKTAAFNRSMMYVMYMRNMFAWRLSRFDGPQYPFPPALCLGGTPLNEAIIAAMEVVPAFKKKNNIQIVNTVFLTDGQGHNTNCTYQEGHFTGVRGNGTVVDPVTKKHYKVWLSDKVLLEILKDRTGTTLAGFYITSANKRAFKNDLGYTTIPWDKRDELWTDMKKNGFCVVADSGYDEYYILLSKNLKIDDNSIIQIESDMTKNKMKNVFINAQKGKIANKKMLSQFAKLVA
jgi:hypothetical protein